MATTNKTCTDADHGKTPQPSPNEAKFTEVVKALLAEKHTHHDLKRRLHQLVMEEAQKLPPIKVVFCASHSGFGFSEEFTTFVHSHTKITNILRALRSDPVLIHAISDYGRFICDKYPFILNDMRTVYTWKLDKLLGNQKQLPMKETEFDADLVTEATSFYKQLSGRWRKDCLGSFPKSDQFIGSDIPDLEAFTEKHPDFWMAHRSIEDHNSFGPPTFQIALRFAHVLLQGGDHARYHVEPDEAQDAAIYKRIGLCGAGTRSADLEIEEIPALVDFSIHVYDGRERVEYGCDGGKEILYDIEYTL